MRQRKIISLGSSFAVTLPKTWVKYNNLKTGNLLTYDIQKDQSLIYRPDKGDIVENELTLLITEKNMDDIKRGIIAGFLNGNKIIRLNSKTYLTSEQQKLIREIAGRFYMMIVKADYPGITLQTIID